MKLVSFQVRTPVGTFTRIGALHGASIVDLNMAQARRLTDQGETQPRRLADAQVPATMLEFLEGGPASTDAARRAFDYAVGHGSSVTGPIGETIFYDPASVRLTAPLPTSSRKVSSR